jgi:hypothetical protein
MHDRYFPFSELEDKLQYGLNWTLFILVCLVTYLWIRKTWL